MDGPPSTSRPPPPKVEPVVYRGIRYEEDLDSFHHGGDQPGGYLKATDVKTGAFLWSLKVYVVEKPSDPGLSAMGRYFRRITQGPGKDELEIENEAGFRYRVDLIKRTSTPAQPPPPPKPVVSVPR